MARGDAELAAAALGWLKADLAYIAANQARRYIIKRVRAELQDEFRAIDDKHGLECGPRPYYSNYKADVARRAQIASWQLKQECRYIDALLKLVQSLVGARRAVSELAALERQGVAAGSANTTTLASQALSNALESVTWLNAYRTLWFDNHVADASAALATTANVVMDDPSTLPTGAAPSTLLDGVVAAQQQAQCVTL